jgi:hypothetical protein
MDSGSCIVRLDIGVVAQTNNNHGFRSLEKITLRSAKLSNPNVVGVVVGQNAKILLFNNLKYKGVVETSEGNRNVSGSYKIM